jgi:fumarylacetoacetate (FAA) hydrolase
MKLVTHQTPAGPRGAILHGDSRDTLLDLENLLFWSTLEAGGSATRAAVREQFGDGVLGFVQHAALARAAVDRAIAALDEVPEAIDGIPTKTAAATATYLAPIPRPPSLRDAYSFEQHVATARKNRGLEMTPDFFRFPVYYFSNHQAVIGPGDLAVRPKLLERLDFELEAAIVLGEELRDADPAKADKAIFGLMVMNDFSARAEQMEEMKMSLGPAKGKDFATGLGPWLVTLDELAGQTRATDKGNVFDLEMRAFVNGKQLSTGKLSDMHFTFAQILERASYGCTLYPGDVIGSGTCGTGCLLELNGSKITHDQWLKDGDSVALEIDGLGRLENRIAAG